MVDFAKTPVTGRAKAVLETLDATLTKRAYDKGMNVSRYLETLDPTEEHTDKSMDAFNRVLRAAGIRTRSVPELDIMASTLEDVVENPRTRHLAVELIARAYRGAARGGKRSPIISNEAALGTLLNQFAFPAAPRANFIQPAIPLTEVVGQTTGIRSTYYKPFYMEDLATEVTARVTEAAEIPAIKIGMSDKIVTLKKYGRRLDVTYETLRRIPIDLLAFYVQRIAVKVEAEKVDKVLDVIVNGDGNAGTAATSYNLTTLDPATTANNLTLRAWLSFKMKFVNPFSLTTVIGQDASVLALMLLNVGNANIPLVAAGGVAAQQGVTPINQGLADGVRAGWLAAAPSGKLVGFDRRFAVERLFEIGGTIQETDKDVKQQINSLVLSEVEGYSILDSQANKVMNLTA